MKVELGFDVEFETPGMPESLIDEFIDRWLGALHTMDLTCGGGRDETGWGFVVLPQDVFASCTEEHRDFVTRWLMEQPEVTIVMVGPLTDAGE